jgi:hypothetical protein
LLDDAVESVMSAAVTMPALATTADPVFAPSFNWRDHLPVHPLADAYPKVPHEQLVEIGESIRRSGLQFPIILHAKGDPTNPDAFELIDGITRLNSMAAVGLEFKFERFSFPLFYGRRKGHSLRLVIHGFDPDDMDSPVTTKIVNNLSDDEIAAYIENANLHRRHLEPEKYHARIEASRARIEAALKRDPEKSDRQLGEELGVDHKTVGKVRAKGEDVGSLPHVETRTDTKGRRQPAKKPKPTLKKTTTTDSPPSPAMDSSPTTPAPSADDSAAQRRRDNERLFDEDHADRDDDYAKADALAPNAVPDDQLIREGEAVAAGSVEAASISRDRILEEFFSSATTDDILARLPQTPLDQIREQAVDRWFGDLDLDAVLGRIPDARLSELTDLCISACTTVETLVVPVKTPKKLLGDLNSTLRWTLDQEDVSNSAQGVKIIRAKLAANKRDARELRLIFVKGK